MSDHYAEAERLIASGNLNAAIAHAILSLVDEFRADQPIDCAPVGEFVFGQQVGIQPDLSRGAL